MPFQESIKLHHKTLIPKPHIMVLHVIVAVSKPNVMMMHVLWIKQQEFDVELLQRRFSGGSQSYGGDSPRLSPCNSMGKLSKSDEQLSSLERDSGQCSRNTSCETLGIHTLLRSFSFSLHFCHLREFSFTIHYYEYLSKS